jgi:RimJ/RimL family protein N-acetyltransferase
MIRTSLQELFGVKYSRAITLRSRTRQEKIMAHDGYTVRAIHRDELDAWWALRLRGLRDHPDAFGAGYEESRERGPSSLEASTREGSVNRLFGAFSPEGELVAQAGVFGNGGKRTHIAVIWGVHTDAAWRGRGLSKALVSLAVDHCRRFSEIRQIAIGVNAGNAAAIAVYTGAGFVPWGTEPRALATEDGFHDEIHMVLMLDREGADDADTAHT